MEKCNLKKLEGKLAIRTKPIALGRDIFGNKNEDYSYTSNPIRILKVTDSHIVYDHKGTNEEKIFKNVSVLDERWLDNNWIDFEELIKIEEEK